MDDDELLRALTRIAQQDPATDPRWRRRSEEKLSEAERAALETLVACSRSAHDAREAFAPLDDEARARLTESILSQLADVNGDAAPPASLTRPIRDRESGIRVRDPRRWPADDVASRKAEASPVQVEVDSLSGTSVAPVHMEIVASGRSEEVTELPDAGALASSAAPQAGELAAAFLPSAAGTARLGPRARASRAALASRPADLHARARAAVAVAGWLAAAALVSLLALRPAPFAPGAAPLPDYVVTVSSDDSRSLSANKTDEVHLAPGARVTLVLKPSTHVRAPVAIKGFLVRRGEVRPWTAGIELDDSGGGRVSGTREALFEGIAAGTWDIVFAIGSPESLPERADVAAEALRNSEIAARGPCRFIFQQVTLD
jgi:hypothetical protein